MSGDGEDENHDEHEDAVYKTYLEPLRVPPAGAETPVAPRAAEPEPVAAPSPQAPAQDDEPDEEAVYKTYLQPIRVPAPQAEAPLATEPEPVAAPTPPPAAQEAESPPPPAPETPAPVAPAASRSDFKDFKFRSGGQARRGRRVLARVAAAIAVAVGLALAYPLVNPFGSSSGSSLKQYLQSFQPIAARADQDRRSVQSAVNAVRHNPKGRKAAARRLASANRDRVALIQRIAALGPAPGAARALPGRLTRLLQSQVQTGRVWQQWMVHRPFVYLKHDAGTRHRIQALLRSQQASKGSFTRLYTQLTRGAGLTGITGS